MVFHHDAGNGPVMKAAKMALETGNANYVLIWVPEESENTLKNLLEKTCCERSARMNMQNRAIDWYFETVNQLYAGRFPQYPNMTTEGLDKKPIILLVERAIETDNFEEIIGVIPNIHEGDVKQRFLDIMDKRDYNINNIAAGRDYVTAFVDFIVYLHILASDHPGETGRTEQ